QAARLHPAKARGLRARHLDECPRNDQAGFCGPLRPSDRFHPHRSTRNEVTSDTILIAGAGIGGVTAALALAPEGFCVTPFDPMEEHGEAGGRAHLLPPPPRAP